jgi:hypothetical protein
MITPIVDGARYRAFHGSNKKWGVESKERGIKTFEIVYEPDFDKDYAKAMAEWMNTNGFVDWETLEAKLTEKCVVEKKRK